MHAITRITGKPQPLQSADAGQCHLQDCGDGSYGASICLKQAGFATVAVVLNGDPAGPPVTLPVLPGKLHALALVSRGHLRTTAGKHSVPIPQIVSRGSTHLVSDLGKLGHAFVHSPTCMLNMVSLDP